MNEHRVGSGSPSPVGEDVRDSDGHYGFVNDHYSSSELGDPIHREVDFDGYSDSADNDDELTDIVSDTFLSLFGSDNSLTDTDDQSDDDEGDSDTGHSGGTPSDFIFVDTQYIPPEGPGEGPIVIGDTQYMPQEEYGPIVVGDTQLPMTYEEHGPIVIGDTQMPDSSAIEIATSPIRAVYDRAEMTAVGEESVRRDLKHRMSNASGDETSEAVAADNKKRKADDNSNKGDEGIKSPPSPPSPPPTLRTRTQFKCAVCLETPDPAVFVHPCGHVFCEGCAQGAVQTTGKCPVCRHAMRARNIRVLQFRIAPIGRTSK